MKIEVGKFYKTRSGGKVRIYANDGGLADKIHGALLRSDGAWVLMWWTADGKCQSGNFLDIISEWTEPLDFDPSCLPAWAEWIAMDENGRWYYYGGEPTILKTYWGGTISGLIPSEYVPKNFTVDWKYSLHKVSDLKTNQS